MKRLCGTNSIVLSCATYLITFTIHSINILHSRLTLTQCKDHKELVTIELGVTAYIQKHIGQGKIDTEIQKYRTSLNITNIIFYAKVKHFSLDM